MQLEKNSNNPINLSVFQYFDTCRGRNLYQNIINKFVRHELALEAHQIESSNLTEHSLAIEEQFSTR